jgi:DNA-binding transcriptional ArsR family regulator
MGTVLRLLDEERLAYLYTQLLKQGDWTATQDLIDASGLPESTVYEALSELRETPLVTAKKDGRQRLYRANPFQLGVLSQGEITTMTPTTLAAVGQQVVDEDVEAFVEDQGIDKLLRVVEYVKPYVDGRMSERVASRELDLPPIVGTTIMVALEEVLTEMQNIDPYFEGIRDASGEGPLPPGDGPIEVKYDELTRIVIEPADNEDR